MFYFLYCSIDRKYEYFCTTGNKNCKCIFLKSIFFKLADVLVEILRVRLWARKLIFLCHRILNSSTLRLLCRGHSFDLCWELLALVIASCDCVPCVRQMTTTRDEKNQFLVTFRGRKTCTANLSEFLFQSLFHILVFSLLF